MAELTFDHLIPKAGDAPAKELDFGHLIPAASQQSQNFKGVFDDIPVAGSQTRSFKGIFDDLPDLPTTPAALEPTAAAGESGLEALTPEQIKTGTESLAAGLRGAARGIPFSQDIGAGLDVARTYLRGHPAGVPTEGPIGRRFAAAKERQKAVDEYLTKQHPAYTLAGQIGGAFALPMAGPAARIASRLEPLVGRGLASAAGTGAVGAGYGAAYGAGEGEDLQQRLKNAEIGALVGGIGGAAIPALASGIGRVARYAAEKVGFGSAPSIAGRQLAGAYKSAARDRAAMTPGQVAEATAANQPVLPIDVGGQAVKGLAKTAATVSPEARGVLATELYQRTKEQAPRLYDFAESLVGKRLDDPDIIKNLRDTARAYNSPAYAAAMQKGAGGVWNERLGQLINHPWIKKAIPEAIDESNANAVTRGQPPFSNPFVVDAAGNYALPVDAQGNTIKPTLEFWDTVKKNIQGKISSAEPTHATRGDPNTVRIGTQLKSALTGELYRMVPEYQKAVQGAGRYLGEEDAFRFGSKFLKSTDAAAINAGKKALSSFTPEERELAKHSYMAERLQKYLNRPENQDISKMFSSPAMKTKDVAILGQDAADKLEAYMLREGLMHNATSALGGSDTMPKLMAAAKFASAHGLGVIGGAGAGAMQGFHESGLEPVNMAKNIASGAMLGWMAQRGLNLADKTALEVAKKLVSNDPAAVQEALNAVAGNPQMLKSLRGAYSASLVPLAARGSVEFLERPQNERAQRADGGRIGLSALDKAARRAHLDISRELEPAMGLPDDVVANALSLAK